MFLDLVEIVPAVYESELKMPRVSCDYRNDPFNLTFSISAIRLSIPISNFVVVYQNRCY